MGSDSNDGSVNSPWQTLAPLRTAVEALPNSGTLTAFVKQGTYTDQHLDMWNTNTGLDVLIGFEPGGSVIEWTNSAIETKPGQVNGVQLGDAPTSAFEIYGNGLTVRGFDVGTGNAFGCYNLAMIVRDVIAEDCVDGLTTHGAGTAEAYDSIFRDCNKAASDNVGSGGIECYGCEFVGQAGATAGIMRMNDTTTGYFEDCTFTPAAANQVMTPKDCEFVRGAIGTVTLVVDIATATPNLVISPETFANINYT